MKKISLISSLFLTLASCSIISTSDSRSTLIENHQKGYNIYLENKIIDISKIYLDRDRIYKASKIAKEQKINLSQNFSPIKNQTLKEIIENNQLSDLEIKIIVNGLLIEQKFWPEIEFQDGSIKSLTVIDDLTTQKVFQWNPPKAAIVITTN